MINPSENLVRNVEKKKFDFALVNRVELESYEEDGKRFYLMPHDMTPGWDAIYKSVTTIIGEKSDKTWYPKWVDRVGQEEADRITAIACRRGSAIHDMAEKYILGEEYWKDHGTINVLDFNKLVPILNKHVDHIYGQEIPLYSHTLKTAGRADLACWWDGYPAIVDFKTTRCAWEKPQDQIDAYMIQAACYARMFQERYDYYMDKIVVLLLVDHEEKPVVYEDSVYPYWYEKTVEYFGS